MTTTTATKRGRRKANCRSRGGGSGGGGSRKRRSRALKREGKQGGQPMTARAQLLPGRPAERTAS